MKYLAYFDGAAEPNPGTMAIAYVILDEHGKTITEHAEACGQGTNNEAEYLALRGLLDEIVRLRLDPVEIYGDSKLVVEQVLGRWQCNHERLRELRDQCRSRLSKLWHVTLSWIPRAQNQKADVLTRGELERQGIQPRTTYQPQTATRRR